MKLIMNNILYQICSFSNRRVFDFISIIIV